MKYLILVLVVMAAIIGIELFWINKKQDAKEVVYQELYLNQGLKAGISYYEDEEAPGFYPRYLLTGFTDGKLMEEPFEVPGTGLKNRIAVKVYFLDQNFTLHSILVPLVVADSSNKLKAVDVSSAGKFEREGITNEWQFIEFFKERLDGKKGKILTLGLRPAERLEDNARQAWIWNPYYNQNSAAYADFLQGETGGLKIIVQESFGSTLFDSKAVVFPADFWSKLYAAE